ncbi:similar to Saccharomyces cerevisiae YER126C NSA2 Protein constituent of 66S pre- ribosomal particles, contributes to processing of the 27S pre-rRNA [Maudiozyma barnettii]|mgnify:FL=1|uniref:Ribosome biogenesis protein NSA2 homolog n=2 Tax=Maudiozyma TaxID=3162980 RepID=A0A1X7R0F9_9SACH|nr:rRNA-processing protein NSA2 [Kazachstania barnettii]CAB4254353.1 similar to Saccharomyces cerevisiae YER126C NSA2 Protein constituent of 66S pre- ribosomal particles, contributes to processing of the 27S pre-rRNA [Kazachstania barnettii]CAD1782217.1 similar to Saccharomyces cerevisiae YER126C NSA2 Protein constituent of 66S pre- ribosomal particles, contributes to processing of the 27S pre-rRNA [Kazachstania barnettii]SMN19071.1 similar to Saccharomyces cerevisiae YER126C NSA2 Protein consti
MPQNEYIEQHIKQHGRRLDYEERKRKREAREAHKISTKAQKLTGWKGKQFAKKRYAEKVAMKKKIRAHEQSKVKGKSKPMDENGDALPTYLLDREQTNTAKAISSSIKQKRLEKADKFSVPLPKVRGISEEEMFRVVKTGKSKTKAWKRMITKHTFVGEGFTRRPVKTERIIRPSALRQKKANVTHPELGVTVFLPILSVKKNPQSPMYTQLGVLTKGTIIEVNVSELGMVTSGGKVVWGKYAQITNEPDRDGCVNAVLLV